jgi:hypothetical protein
MEGRTDRPILIRRLICDGAEDPVTTNDDCHDAFTDAEQTAILEQLRPLGEGDVRFFDEFDGPGRVRLWVGPLEPRGDGYVVGGGMVCGGLCGSGGTFRLSPDPNGGWTVTPADMRWVA